MKRSIKHPKAATETLPSRTRTESRRLKRKQLDRTAAIANCEARADWRSARADYEDLGELLAHEYERLVGLAASRGCNEPRDAVHDAWLRACQGFDPYRGRPGPFFRKVLIRQVLDGFRKFYRRQRIIEPQGAQCSEVLGNGAASRWWQVQILDLLLDHLPDQESTILRACYADGRLQEQVASSMGITPGTLRTRLFRARNRLQALLKQLGIESLAEFESLEVADCYHIALRRASTPSVKRPRPPCRKSLKP